MNLLTLTVEMIEERREHPADDFVSSLLHAEIDGEPLDDDDMLLMTVLLVVAGIDTTAAAIASTAWYLLEHPEDRLRLIAEPRLLDSAVEEFVRWASPVAGTARTVVEDTDIAGCPLRAGDKLWMLWASGNRDEDQFPEPASVALDRHPNRHMGFGMGPHRCVGSHQGKFLMKVALEEMLGPLGDFEIADPSTLEWASRETRGLVKLPVVRKAQ